VLTVALAIAAVPVSLVMALLVERRRHARRLEAALTRLHTQLQPIADSLRDAADRAEMPERRRVGGRPLAPSIERLLERIAAEGAPAYAFRRLAEELQPELGEARRLPPAKRPATRDELTGVRDRNGYEAELEREIARAERSGRPLALLLFDLGDLTETRVRTGHAEADRLLRELAALLVRSTRLTDAVCRRRRGEFGVVLPDTTANDALCVRRRVREAAGRTSFGRIGAVTFSSGVVEWRPNESREVLDARARLAVGRSPADTFDAREAKKDDSLGTPHAR
jgi:diguanylate cyclase (GGDEF)-like protein